MVMVHCFASCGMFLEFNKPENLSTISCRALIKVSSGCLKSTLDMIVETWELSMSLACAARAGEGKVTSHQAHVPLDNDEKASE